MSDERCMCQWATTLVRADSRLPTDALVVTDPQWPAAPWERALVARTG